jgi:hypothetical protein
MATAKNAAFRTYYVGSGHAADVERFGGCALPPAIAAPYIECVCPAAFVEVIAKDLNRVINADGHNGDTLFPVRMLFA